MKYQEGMSALAEAQRIEGEEAKRIDTINQQLNTLRLKEKEMTEVEFLNSTYCIDDYYKIAFLFLCSFFFFYAHNYT